MREASGLLREWSGCEAVGIRLRDGDDYPYFETQGFPSSFVAMENHLCAYDAAGRLLCNGNGSPVLECMCGNVLQNRFDPARPFFTSEGSFWTNSTSALLASTSEVDRQARTRNRCHGQGYESVALIPLRVGGETFGLMQLNDPRRGLFTAEMIAQLERLAGSLAMGLAQRKAVDQLQESEAKFRSVFEQAPNSILLIDAWTGQLVDFNGVAQATLGYSPSEIAGLTVYDLENIDRAKKGDEYLTTVRMRDCDTFETVHRTKDGTPRSMLVNRRSIRLQRRDMLLDICTDITQRKEFEEQLTQYQRITSATPDSIALVDRHYRYRTVNDAYLQRTGLPRDAIVGHLVEDVVGREAFLATMKSRFDACLSGREVRYQAWFDFATEGRRFLDVRYTPYRDADGSVTGLLASMRDITDLKHAEDELRESEERYRLLVEVAPVSILAVQDGRIVFANPRGADLMGYERREDVVGVEVLSTIAASDHDEILKRMRRIDRRKSNTPLELHIVRRDGAVVLTESISVPFMLGGRPAALVVGQDITERRRIDRLRGEAEKLASTGRMAARVAHEINNPLAGIKYAFQLIKDAVPAAHPDRDMADRIESEIDRIAHIVRQMYTLHSPGAERSRAQSIHTAMDDVLLLLEPLRREQGVRICLAPVPLDCVVNMPESSLHQVLFNLISNALEASHLQGSVEIAARRQEAQVVIEVTDHGVGIPAEIRPRIYDPFFTTKGDGRARASMGIGLSVVRNIVESCAGRLEMASEPGEETTFRVYFPAILTSE